MHTAAADEYRVLPLCHTIGNQPADPFPELTVTLVAVPENVGAHTVPAKHALPLAKLMYDCNVDVPPPTKPILFPGRLPT